MGARAIPRLLEALRNESPGVRAQVVRILGKSPRPEVLPALYRLLLDDPDAAVREAAAEVLEVIDSG
jgi:HEAT repeat protein